MRPIHRCLWPIPKLNLVMEWSSGSATLNKLLKMDEPKKVNNAGCFDPLQKDRRMLKLINDSLSQRWLKERLKYL